MLGRSLCRVIWITPKIAHRQNLRYRAILPELLLELVDNLPAILVLSEVNEVDDNDSTEVAKPELVCQYLSGFKVNLKASFPPATLRDPHARSSRR